MERIYDSKMKYISPASYEQGLIHNKFMEQKIIKERRRHLGLSARNPSDLRIRDIE